MKRVGVKCYFDDDGRVQIQQIIADQEWIPVDQGRQWLDKDGRHVLIMMPDNRVMELCLRPVSLIWDMTPAGKTVKHFV